MAVASRMAVASSILCAALSKLKWPFFRDRPLTYFSLYGDTLPIRCGKVITYAMENGSIKVEASICTTFAPRVRINENSQSDPHAMCLVHNKMHDTWTFSYEGQSLLFNLVPGPVAIWTKSTEGG